MLEGSRIIQINKIAEAFKDAAQIADFKKWKTEQEAAKVGRYVHGLVL